MARKRSVAQTTIAVAPVARRMEEFPIDESKVDLGPKFGHIRDGQIYLSAGLTRYMEERWGVFTAVVTSTNSADSTVTVFKADPIVGEPVPVNRYGTMSSAVFSFFVPLQKLNLKPAKSHQFEVIPYEQPIEGAPPAFVFNMDKRRSIPRNAKEEAEAAGLPAEGEGAETAAEA